MWKEELFRQDIELPGVSAGDVRDVVLESPFLVVGGGRYNADWIKVFQLAVGVGAIIEKIIDSRYFGIFTTYW